MLAPDLALADGLQAVTMDEAARRGLVEGEDPEGIPPTHDQVAADPLLPRAVGDGTASPRVRSARLEQITERVGLARNPHVQLGPQADRLGTETA